MKEDLIKKILENTTGFELNDMLVNINRRRLNSKKHIKKYNKLRNLHSEIVDNMMEYALSGKYDIEKLFEALSKDNIKDKIKLNFNLDIENPDDETIITELFIYKNHENVPSVTEIYLEKNKFRNKEKLALLNAMKNSHASLFKIVDVDQEEGYVYCEDVFTHKKYPIIDIAMSSTYKPNPQKIVYMYNRIITIDGISFATGIHCMLTSENKKLKDFLKKHKYNSKNNVLRCLSLYHISQEEKNLKTKYNHQYGNNR